MAKRKDPWNRTRKTGVNKPPLQKGEPNPLLPLGPGGSQLRFSLGYALALLVGVALFNWLLIGSDSTVIPYSVFKEKIRTGEINKVEIGQNWDVGWLAQGADASAPKRPELPLMGNQKTAATVKTAPVNDPGLIPLLEEKSITYQSTSRETSGILSFVFSWILPIAFMVFLWRILSKRLGGGNSNVLAFGQNKATIVAEGDIPTRFTDVAGVDEAKEELVEVVDFLKNPKKYTDIGGKIPKGVLLVGPPGTGKTLLARAVAGEAGVSFFRMSGADFVEMFVGVGAARVRDLFKQARGKAPCIIFIDELDAIGKSRIVGPMGGNDEREQTLNQLLVEMDGFDATSGLIILAATNRPDVLDPALLRAGRFDRQVLVDRPDLVGREAILKIHAKQVKLDTAVDLAKVARGTPGFVGADLANIVNEAALHAVRRGRKKVQHADFDSAIEKIVAGLEKKSRVMNPAEREIIACHESGHAVAAAFTKGADPVKKISIVPRGFGALGYTLQLPVEDRYIVTEDELLGQIDVLLGGRASEQLRFGRVSTGAANDLTRATDVARRMISDYGMSERFRNMALTRRGQSMMGPSAEPLLGREYSEETQRYVDEEIARIIASRYAQVLSLLSSHRGAIDAVTETLLEKETVDEAEFIAILGGISA
ncbi:MAG TPA: ATP-dependent zinc metalloprotease FtsH [Rectinemataceae bacterium]|nr:ATP-dependent zinc metalloprotease FtsH [Rectinemataceae bacterium]